MRRNGIYLVQLPYSMFSLSIFLHIDELEWPRSLLWFRWVLIGSSFFFFYLFFLLLYFYKQCYLHWKFPVNFKVSAYICYLQNLDLHRLFSKFTLRNTKPMSYFWHSPFLPTFSILHYHIKLFFSLTVDNRLLMKDKVKVVNILKYEK